MKKLSLFLIVALTTTASFAKDTKGKLLLSDDFNRTEKDDSKEQLGGKWGTNSRSRAKGVKQVDLKDGAMHVKRADVADHGVSIHHDLSFKDVTIQLRFKLGAKDDLGINIADMKEKGVHAGHICMAKIRTHNVEIFDLKYGNMKIEHRTARKAGKETPAMKKATADKNKRFPSKISANEWHDLEVRIDGDLMTVSIDGKKVGSFESEGIGHPTKSRLRLAIAKSAVIDDINVWSR